MVASLPPASRSTTHHESGFISCTPASSNFSGALGSPKRARKSGPAPYFAPLSRMTSPQSVASIVSRASDREHLRRTSAAQTPRPSHAAFPRRSPSPAPSRARCAARRSSTCGAAVPRKSAPPPRARSSPCRNTHCPAMPRRTSPCCARGCARSISRNSPLRGKPARLPFTVVHSSRHPTPSALNCPPSHSMSFTSTMRFTPSRAACTAAAHADSLPPTMSRSAIEHFRVRGKKRKRTPARPRRMSSARTASERAARSSFRRGGRWPAACMTATRGNASARSPRATR